MEERSFNYTRDDATRFVDELKDRVHDLYDENHKLKELCDRYEEEHNNEFKKWQETTKRIDKAIEYMDRRDLEWGSEEHNKLLSILKGEDKE